MHACNLTSEAFSARSVFLVSCGSKMDSVPSSYYLIGGYKECNSSPMIAACGHLPLAVLIPDSISYSSVEKVF
jgi:hypothetical protein